MDFLYHHASSLSLKAIFSTCTLSSRHHVVFGAEKESKVQATKQSVCVCVGGTEMQQGLCSEPQNAQARSPSLPLSSLSQEQSSQEDFRHQSMPSAVMQL